MEVGLEAVISSIRNKRFVSRRKRHRCPPAQGQLHCPTEVHRSESVPGEGGITLVEGGSILRLAL